MRKETWLIIGLPAKKVKGKLCLNASCYLEKGQADKGLALIGILKVLHKHNHKPRGHPGPFEIIQSGSFEHAWAVKSFSFHGVLCFSFAVKRYASLSIK